VAAPEFVEMGRIGTTEKAFEHTAASDFYEIFVSRSVFRVF